MFENQYVTNETGTNVPEEDLIEKDPILSLIKKVCIEQGVSQRVFVKSFGLSHTTVQRYVKLIKKYYIMTIGS